MFSILGSSYDQGGQSEFCGNENFNGRTQKRFTSKLSGLAVYSNQGLLSTEKLSRKTCLDVSKNA